jgi:TPR repeat protein
MMMQFWKTENYPRARAGTSILAAVVLLFLYQVPAFSTEMWEQLLEEQLEQANDGDADAQYGVGIKYLKGQGVKQDRREAMMWFERAAVSGHEGAQDKLSRMQDQEKDFKQLLSKAEAGDLKAQYQVGTLYLKGKGVDSNGRKARTWIGKASERGVKKATTRLGILYYKGEGGAKDYKRAFKLFNEVSSDSVLAQYYLGEMYAEGKGVKKDYTTAINWYTKAVEGGYGRAGGKIINMEEEIRMDKRRKLNAARKKESNEAETRLAVKKQREKEQQQADAAVQLATARKQAAQRKKKAAAKAKKVVRLSPLEKLANKKWTRKKKQVEYLPSTVTDCEMEKGKLVCFSGLMTRTSGSNTVHYRVKSEVKSSKGVFHVTYSNLVVDVIAIENDEEELLGYNDEADQGFHIKTGWTQNHNVECRLNTSGGMDCIKDRTHKMAIAGK